MNNQLFCELIGFEVDNFCDTAGRPLGEQRASRIYENIDTELRTCQLPGSRHHHPKQVNWSAMKGILSSWRETVAFLNCLDIEYKKHLGRSGADYLDFWLKTAISVMLPSYLVFQNEAKYRDGQLPLAVSSVYKIAAGAVLVARRAYVTGRLGLSALEYSPLAFFEYAEGAQFSIGPKQVCPGPKNMFLDCMSLLMGVGEGLVRRDKPAWSQE